MRRTTRIAAVVATAAAAALLAGPDLASARTGHAGASGASAAPCSIDDVSFYFGGASEGLSQRSFDLTLLAHDGITCTLSDTPLITVSGPPAQKKPIPLTVNGRGGTLVLRPDSPLHATFFYAIPDLPKDTLKVSGLTLAMPDGTKRATDFLFPGTTQIYSGGISITSWTTGIGLGQGEEAY